MELHTIGLDLGKTIFHLVGLNLRGEGVVRKKLSTQATTALHGEPAGRIDWHGRGYFGARGEVEVSGLLK